MADPRHPPEFAAQAGFRGGKRLPEGRGAVPEGPRLFAGAVRCRDQKPRPNGQAA